MIVKDGFITISRESGALLSDPASKSRALTTLF